MVRDRRVRRWVRSSEGREGGGGASKVDEKLEGG